MPIFKRSAKNYKSPVKHGLLSDSHSSRDNSVFHLSRCLPDIMEHHNAAGFQPEPNSVLAGIPFADNCKLSFR